MDRRDASGSGWPAPVPGTAEVRHATMAGRRQRAATSTALFSGHVGAATGIAVYIGVVGILNLLLLILAPAGQPPLRLALASGMLWLSTLPLFDVVRRKPKQVPLVPVISLLYFMYFGLPVFIGTTLVKGQPYEVEEVTTAVGLTLAGLGLLQVAFYSPIGRILDHLPNLQLRVEIRWLGWYFIVVAFFGVALSAYVLTSAKDIPPMFKALANVSVRTPLVLLGGLFLLHLRGTLSWPQKIAGAACYLMYLLFSLASGALAVVAWALVPMFFIYVAERGTIPWKTGVVCFILAMPFAYTKHTYRQEIRNTYVGPLDRIALFVNITIDQASYDRERMIEKSSQSAGERTSYLGTFAYVVNRTPRRIPMLDGATYEVMLWAFVPRLLAPDRPMQSLGQDFGHRYRLLNPHDYATSFNCPQIIELYINYGHLGVLVGMTLIGFYYRLLYALFNHGNGGDGMVLLASVPLAGLLNIESDAGNVLVGALQSCVFCYVIIQVIVLFARYIVVPGKERG